MRRVRRHRYGLFVPWALARRWDLHFCGSDVPSYVSRPGGGLFGRPITRESLGRFLFGAVFRSVTRWACAGFPPLIEEPAPSLGSNLALYILSSWVMMCGHNRRIGPGRFSATRTRRRVTARLMGVVDEGVSSSAWLRPGRPLPVGRESA